MKTAQPAHPAWEELAAFDLGQLSDDAWATMVEHLANCEACGSLIDTVPRDGFVRGLRSASQADEITVGHDHDNAEHLRHNLTSDVPAGLIGHPRYRIVEPLGAGGMGMVFKAEHILMARFVAVKVLQQNLCDRRAAIDRLAREVKALARLSHPNLVAAFDAEHCGESLYVVMEYVEGDTLDRIIRRCGTLPFGLTCTWIGEAALGLQYAFEHGLVHRDLKPSNLLVTPQGQVKILDFGLARLIDEDDSGSAQTPDGSMVGTPAYTAPEQARDPKTSDIRADLYSLGCTWYEMLTGRPPFPGATTLQQLLAHQDQAPRPVTQCRSDVPREVDAIFARLLAKDPAGRFQTPAEFLQALKALDQAPAPPSTPRAISRGSLAVMTGIAIVFLLLLSVGVWQMMAYLGSTGGSNPQQRVEPKPEPKKPDPRRPDGSSIVGWGKVIDPDGDCTIREENGLVSITIPGTQHDINPTKERRNAPRILRDILGDFRAVVRVSGDFMPAGPSTYQHSVPFNGAGLLLYADETNLLWLARNRFIAWPKADDLCFAPLFAFFHDGKPLDTNPPRTSSLAFKGASTFLRLERTGDLLRGAYSHDGKSWEGWRETTTTLPTKLQIGVAVVSTSSQPFSVTFDGFKILDE